MALFVGPPSRVTMGDPSEHRALAREFPRTLLLLDWAPEIFTWGGGGAIACAFIGLTLMRILVPGILINAWTHTKVVKIPQDCLVDTDHPPLPHISPINKACPRCPCTLRSLFVCTSGKLLQRRMYGHR